MLICRDEVNGDPAVLIGKTLASLGVRRVYTVCGGHISPFLRGCANENIEVIGGRDERTLAYAASIEAALTRFPGTVVVTAGPGAAYAFGAMKNAWFKKVPLVVLSGTTATSLAGRGSLQDSDQLGDMSRYAKRAVRITRARDIPEALAELYEAALAGLPGPVYGELAMDAGYPRALVEKWYGDAVRDSNAAVRWIARRNVRRLQDLPETIDIPELRRPAPGYSPELVSRAAEWLRSAAQPIMLLGGEIAWSPCPRTIIDEAVRKIGVPCYVNDLARGIVREDNPFLFSRSRSAALKDADRILLAGIAPDFRLGYGMWGGGIPRSAEVMRIGLEPDYLRKNLRTEYRAQADPGLFVAAVAENLASTPKTSLTHWMTERLRTVEREKIKADSALMAEEERRSGGRIHPIRLGRILEEFLASQRVRTRIVVADGGDFTAIVAREVRSCDAWLDAGPFGSLGGGAGFALAAASAMPHALVVAVFGDGAFGYSAMEFHTLAARRCGVIGIVGNNGAWEQIARSDRETYGSSTAATALPDAKYERIARAFGGFGARAETPDVFSAALEAAYAVAAAGIPSIVNAYLMPTRARAGSLAV